MLEFLTESDVPDSVKDVVEVIGMDAFKDLVKLAGGSNLYIPNESNLVTSRHLGITTRFFLQKAPRNSFPS